MLIKYLKEENLDKIEELRVYFKEEITSYINAKYSKKAIQKFENVFDIAFRAFVENVKKGHFYLKKDTIIRPKSEDAKPFLRAVIRDCIEAIDDKIETINLILSIEKESRLEQAKAYKWYKSRLVLKHRLKFPKVPKVILEGAFDDSFMVVVERINNGKFYCEKVNVKELEQDYVTIEPASGSVENYMYIVMRNKIIKFLKWQKKHPTLSVGDYQIRFDTAVNDAEEKQYREDLSFQSTNVWGAFKMLKPFCQELLSGILLHGFSYKEMVMELTNKQEGEIENMKLEAKKARVQKYRCVKQLRKNYEQIFK